MKKITILFEFYDDFENFKKWKKVKTGEENKLKMEILKIFCKNGNKKWKIGG